MIWRERDNELTVPLHLLSKEQDKKSNINSSLSPILLVIRADCKMSAIENFCGSTFWNTSLTWNNLNPEFTECFHQTVLSWLPGAILTLFLATEIRSKQTSEKLNMILRWSAAPSFDFDSQGCSIMAADPAASEGQDDRPWYKGSKEDYPFYFAEPFRRAGTPVSLSMYLMGSRLFWRQCWSVFPSQGCA